MRQSTQPTPATWHPQALRDATLTGLPATCVLAVDPGRPTGLAILRWVDGYVQACTWTLQVPPGTVQGRTLSDACFTFQREAFLLSGPWAYAAELGQVFARRGQDSAEASGRWKSMASVARLEGQLQASLCRGLELTGQHLYLAQEWREGVLGRGGGKMKGALAKGFAVDFVRRQFGVEGALADHEAEALCVGLHCLRELAREHRGEQRLALDLACPESAPKQARGRRSAARR